MVGKKLGSYDILEEVGHGGMATVYRAHQASMNRDVAIKVIQNTIADDTDIMHRFQREARLIARLEHPHILPVYDFDGRHDPPYIVMRYLNTGTLKDVMAQGLLPLDEVSYLIQQVAAALDYAHRQGIVHRDIKPSNIMIDQDGNAFVSDFGLARAITNQQMSHEITASGAVLGTPSYMSPEQISDGTVDHRADIYALGVILYQMLIGQLPYTASRAMSVLLKHLHDPIPSVSIYKSSLPVGIDEIVTRALAKSADDRFQSIIDFASAVMQTLGVVTQNPQQLRRAIEDSTIHRALEVSLNADHTPSEQNKTITALYTNAAEFAELIAEVEGSEVARRSISNFWETVTTLTENFRGVVVSQTDESLLAVWGAEMAQEDDAERAIHAALSMQTIMQEITRDLLESDELLPLNIALHTGLALLKPGSQPGSLSASGSTISLANRLMRQADGIILITHTVYNQVRGIFDMTPDASLKIRRSQATVVTYRVRAAKTRAFRTNTRGIEGIETQMVGREAEFKTLQNAFLDVMEEAETQAITIVGEAGVGKSRLLYEFSSWADLRQERYWLVRGRATPEMTLRPYALLRDMLSFRYEILDNDKPSIVQEKLTKGIASQIGSHVEMAHLLGHLAGFDLSRSPHISDLLGDPQQLTSKAKQMFKQWLAALSHIQPVIIELEDIHYSDEPTLDLLTELTNEYRELPLLLLCLTRPNLFEHRPTWGSGQEAHVQVRLQALDRRDSRAMVREVLQKIDRVPTVLRDLLVKRSGGNPYYMEELVKVLIDDRIIFKESEDNWRVEASRLGQIQVPTTLVGLLQARLDGLLYSEKLTLQRAAIMGRIFYDGALLVLDAADETHLDDLPKILQHLVEREFIYLRETTAFDGYREYIFANQMLREVLLNTLLRRQKEIYNRAAAEWLIKNSGERVNEYARLVAEHFELGGQVERALVYLRQAISQATAQDATSEAVAYLSHAIDIGRKNHIDNEQIGGLLRDRGSLLHRIGDQRAALADLEEYFNIASHAELKIDALSLIGRQHSQMGQHQKALGAHREALQLATALNDTEGRAKAYTGVGWALWGLGRLEEALSNLDKALALFSQLHDGQQQRRVRNLLGLTYMDMGKIDKSIAAYKAALALDDHTLDNWERAILLGNLGESYQCLFDMEQALVYHEEAMRLAEMIEAPSAVADICRNIGVDLVALGEMERGIEHLYTALTLSEDTGQPDIKMQTLYRLVLAELESGNIRTAQEHARALHQMAEAGEATSYLADAYHALGLCHQYLEDETAARQFWQQAVLVAHEAGKQMLIWQLHAALAHIAPTAELAEEHKSKAAKIVYEIVESIEDEALRQKFLNAPSVLTVIQSVKQT